MEKCDFQRFRLLVIRILDFYFDKIQRMMISKMVFQILGVKIDILEATGEDLKMLGWQRLNNDNMHSRITDDVTFIVGKVEKLIVAYVQLVIRTNTCNLYAGAWLHDLYVRIPFRRIGIAKRLIQKSISIAIEKGSTDVLIRVRESNHRAIQLYRDLGFKRKVIPELEEENGYEHYVRSVGAA